MAPTISEGNVPASWILLVFIGRPSLKCQTSLASQIERPSLRLHLDFACPVGMTRSPRILPPNEKHPWIRTSPVIVSSSKSNTRNMRPSISPTSRTLLPAGLEGHAPESLLIGPAGKAARSSPLSRAWVTRRQRHPAFSQISQIPALTDSDALRWKRSEAHAHSRWENEKNRDQERLLDTSRDAAPARPWEPAPGRIGSSLMPPVKKKIAAATSEIAIAHSIRLG